ncbi:MAG: protein translocase subunit SecF [Kistimonas sp.]|nr:protein translocase subunit SecF [Kistimonas sp.]
MRWRVVAVCTSLILVLGSVVSLGINGLNLGLDFTGGTLVELSYDKPVDIAGLRTQLEEQGYADVMVQEFGSTRDVLIRVPGGSSGMNPGDKISQLLTDSYAGTLTVNRIEFIGPQVGEQLRDQGGLGMLLALVLVMLYIAFRFQFKFSLGAVVALTHDSIVVLGFFSLFRLTFDLTVLAALLAVIGYSLNDTIIVYDRVRENFRKLRRSSLEEIIDVSLSQTLGRTLATSGTTMMVLLALYFLGGDAIKGFSLALLVGVGIGTYSSIYIASAMLVHAKLRREDLIPPDAANSAADDKN